MPWGLICCSNNFFQFVIPNQINGEAHHEKNDGIYVVGRTAAGKSVGKRLRLAGVFPAGRGAVRLYFRFSGPGKEVKHKKKAHGAYYQRKHDQ